MTRLAVVLIFTSIVFSPSFASKKVCQNYIELISLNGEKHSAEQINNVVDKNDKLEFVLKKHNIWYVRSSKIHLCVPQNLSLKYEKLANNQEWLISHGFGK